MKRSLVILLLLVSITGISQSSRYQSLIYEARSLYLSHWYKQSAETFSKAFKANNWNATVNDRLLAASAWAQIDGADSAFYQLNRIVQVDRFQAFETLVNNPAFVGLKEDSRWFDLLAVINKKRQEAEAKINLPVKHLLDSIYNRQLLILIQKGRAAAKQPHGTPLPAGLNKVFKQQGAELCKAVTQILDQYGWLSVEEIGTSGTNTIGLLLTGADSNTQQKYLPMMRAAFDKGNCRGVHVAAVTDDIALRRTGRQIYGTKVVADPDWNGHYLLVELQDPERVNERRAALELGTIEAFMESRLSSSWSMGNYRKELSWTRKVYAMQKMATRAEEAEEE